MQNKCIVFKNSKVKQGNQMFLYITYDRIGTQTGGGSVTKNELEALTKLGPVDIINPQPTQDPFEAEKKLLDYDLSKYKLAHFYAGTFPQLTKKLKEKGIKISYTAAAHDTKESQEEFKQIGIKYDFPHITNQELWKSYLSSYLNADLVICPSTHSQEVMTQFGCKNITIIPHGCEKGSFYPLPKVFNVGYLGQVGPDKGVKYLIEAWSKLNYKDAILTFAGSQSPLLIHLIRHYKHGNYNILGFVKKIDEFYKSISVYVQPSVTEGFGIEVLESMSFGRPVICSDGAGAVDTLHSSCKNIQKRNVKEIMDAIDFYKNTKFTQSNELINWTNNYDWSTIQKKYIEVWKKLLNS
jgi:glycosyltransferase involved in cell wall biosynthesis